MSLRSESFCAIGSRLEGKTSVQLNLPAGTDSRENPSDVAGEVTRWVFEHGVSIPSQGKRALRVAWNCKIRSVEQIVGFRAKRNPRAFRQMELFLYREIKLRKCWAAQNIASGSAKLARRR